MNSENSPKGNPIEILIAEDSPTQAARLIYILEEHYYKVLHAPNGKQALLMARQYKPTLLISDIIMPEMDGYQLCQQIKQEDDLKNIAVILLTSLSDPIDVIKGLQCGADNFITKPYDESYLLSRIQLILANRAIRIQERTGMGVEIYFAGNKYLINSERQQILDLLLSTYETAVSKNAELQTTRDELLRLNDQLEESNRNLQKAKREADYANQAKSEFLSRMSHELRTPMNSILGFAQLLETDTIEPLTESQRENVVQILKAGSHLLELINEVLELSRIETGRIKVSLEPLELLPVLGEVLQLIEPTAERYGVRMNAAYRTDKKYVVKADRTRLKQVLLNLLSNAVKYNKRSGLVTLTTEPCEEHRIRINVTDTGPGIPASKQDKLFNPFERLGAENTEVEGTGIGLSITKRLTEAMEGNIGFTSEVDVGSTFFLEFQQVDLDMNKETNATQTSAEPLILKEGEKTVLYIEDNPANLTLMIKILSRRPWLEVLTAPEAQLGIDLARDHHPDLIFLDINLPGMNGYEAIKFLQTYEDTRDIPVVAVSADAMQRDIEKALKCGFRDYLAKPLNITDVLTVIDQVLGS